MNELSYEQLLAYIQGLYDEGGLSEEDYNRIILYILANGNLETSPRDLLQIRRGLKENLPNLAQGEMGFTIDTEELFIGGINGVVNLSDREYTTPLRFGGVGNGVNDDTEAFQQAIDFIDGKGGGVVVIPPTQDFYKITDDIILKSGVDIIGFGEKSFLKGSVRLRNTYPIKNVTIKGLKIDSEFIGNNSIIDLRTQNDVNPTNIHILKNVLNLNETGQSCIAFTGVINGSISFNECENSGVGSNITISSYCKNVVVSNNTVENSGRSGVFIFEYCKEIVIENNKITGWMNRHNLPDGGIEMYGVDLFNITIRNNILDTTETSGDGDHYGITVRGVNTHVHNNHIKMRSQVGYIAIPITNRDGFDGENIVVENNKVEVEGKVRYLFRCFKNHNLMIKNNTVIMGEAGEIVNSFLEIRLPCTSISFNENTIYGNGRPTNHIITWGALEPKMVDKLFVANNKIYDVTGRVVQPPHNGEGTEFIGVYNNYITTNDVGVTIRSENIVKNYIITGNFIEAPTPISGIGTGGTEIIENNILIAT